MARRRATSGTVAQANVSIALRIQVVRNTHTSGPTSLSSSLPLHLVFSFFKKTVQDAQVRGQRRHHHHEG